MRVLSKRVALISPKGNIFGKNQKMLSFLTESQYMESFKLLWTGPNLGLLVVAAMFPKDWECEYIDENYHSIDFEASYDIVCISAMTQQALRAYEISETFRKKGALTIMGGIHATVLPEEVGNYVDVVMSGEAEVLFKEFIKDYTEGSVKKYYSEEIAGQFDIKNSPKPRFELLEGYKYPLVNIQTTRGCPHDCSFCAASKVFGSAYRRKNNQNIISELEELSSRFPDTLILFADDNMFVHRKQCKELLQSMVKLKIRWICQTDISIAKDTELLELMVKAGCQWVVIGFESVSYDSLYELDNKNWKLSKMPKYEEMIETIQSYGIGVYGTFIVGLDQDSSNVFKDTADFIVNNSLYGANITVPTPLPGTRLREQLKGQGRVKDLDWSYYTLWDVVINPHNFTQAELEDGLVYIYWHISSDTAAINRLSNLKKLAKIRNKILKTIK